MANKNNKGFTLVEILVVILIVSAIAFSCVFAFNSFKPTIQLSGAARNMISDLHYTQQLAVTEQVKYCFKMFLQDKKYQIKKCDGAGQVIEKNLPQEIKDFSISGFSNDQIEFNSLGAVKESGFINLTNNLDKTKKIDVRPSGFVKIIN